MNSVFAARLTKLRRERGMSQKDAAKNARCVAVAPVAL